MQKRSKNNNDWVLPASQATECHLRQCRELLYIIGLNPHRISAHWSHILADVISIVRAGQQLSQWRVMTATNTTELHTGRQRLLENRAYNDPNWLVKSDTGWSGKIPTIRRHAPAKSLRTLWVIKFYLSGSTPPQKVFDHPMLLD